MNDSKDHKAAAEPPLDCRVGRDELCLEDDGDVGMDWMTPERDVLSMSLRSDGRIAYAVRMSDGRVTCGTADIAPEAYEVLRKLVPNEQSSPAAEGSPRGA